LDENEIYVCSASISIKDNEGKELLLHKKVAEKSFRVQRKPIVGKYSLSKST